MTEMPKVKILQWEPEIGHDGSIISDAARCPFGMYTVERDTFSADHAYEVWGPGGFNKRCSIEADAFAAAQADFEAKVKSALILDDGTCCRCGSAPRNSSGLCATCVDEDAERAGEIQSQAMWREALDAERVVENLCSDCPPYGYPTNDTRCAPCPRRPSPTASPIPR